MSESAADAAQRLLDRAERGELAALCERERIDLFVLFGSAGRGESNPRDIDVAVRFAENTRGDVLSLLDGLYRLTRYEGFDVLDLRRAGPVARDRALSEGRPLYQARPGLYGNAQIAAMMERMETREFRRVQLELLSR